jgi:hypothetical protein
VQINYPFYTTNSTDEAHERKFNASSRLLGKNAEGVKKYEKNGQCIKKSLSYGTALKTSVLFLFW